MSAESTLESRIRSAAVARFPSLCARLMLVEELDPVEVVLLLALLTMLTLLLL